MDAPVDYSIDDLASRTIIKEYGDIAMVTIPGCSMLPESERVAVFAQAKLQQTLGCDGSFLSSRLRCLTPPLDEDEETELSKSLELDARLALEPDGCPPCYPSGLDLAQQTHLQTWIEYLHHNLKRMEQFEKRRDRLKKELSGPIKAEDMETVLNELENEILNVTKSC